MKYALLVYSHHEMPSETTRSLHDPAAYTALDTSAATVLAHYRLRPAHLTTTLRRAGAEITQSSRPSTEKRKTLRALFLLESSDEQAVIDIAAQLPALQSDGSVEVWPLTEPNRSGHRRRH